mmetsp:Transcript_26753/g.39576  ORF Transcript_26753/g.39576 Transcript_26753/m.39576 type:complete len:237 (-) Transcript_26753:915-1625(-)
MIYYLSVLKSVELPILDTLLFFDLPTTDHSARIVTRPNINFAGCAHPLFDIFRSNRGNHSFDSEIAVRISSQESLERGSLCDCSPACNNCRKIVKAKVALTMSTFVASECKTIWQFSSSFCFIVLLPSNSFLFFTSSPTTKKKCSCRKILSNSLNSSGDSRARLKEPNAIARRPKLLGGKKIFSVFAISVGVGSSLGSSFCIDVTNLLMSCDSRSKFKTLNSTALIIRYKQKISII